MGREIGSAAWEFHLPDQFRSKVRAGLDVLDRLLATERFAASTPMTGAEMELDIITRAGEPSYRNTDIIEGVDNGLAVERELARFNLEINAAPRRLEGTALRDIEDDFAAALDTLGDVAARFDSAVLPIGILPTLRPEHYQREWMSEGTRFQALNDAIIRARGEDIILDIDGSTGERLAMGWPTIAPESACTSFQLHLQVTPRDFPRAWNSAQAIAGVQLAIGANSPFFFGKSLWHETRIPLFTQAVDTRPLELANQGVLPRVGFGSNWITSIFDLFEDNVQHFPALLPELSDEDPVAVFEAGGIPELSELMLHNGTVYRWNRPVYDTAGGAPHLRVENRVLPAGPTPADMVANAAFFFGLVRFLSRQTRPIWSKMSFAAAASNFEAGARHGFDAVLYWPGVGRIRPPELVTRHLLPIAEAGLRDLGADAAVIARYLDIIEERCLTRTNGAAWQLAAVTALESHGRSRAEALTEMTLMYAANAKEGSPVHTWEVPAIIDDTAS